MPKFGRSGAALPHPLGGVGCCDLAGRGGGVLSADLLRVPQRWRCVRGQRENLGPNAALVAASALLVDYVLTVAVSVAAGVDAITSAFLSLRPYSVELSVLFIAVLALMNLRGVKESGTVFAIPTYGFIAVIFGMIGWGFWRLTGDAPVARICILRITPSHSVTGLALVLLA